MSYSKKPENKGYGIGYLETFIYLYNTDIFIYILDIFHVLGTWMGRRLHLMV